jgi:hypothetical protein
MSHVCDGSWIRNQGLFRSKTGFQILRSPLQKGV